MGVKQLLKNVKKGKLGKNIGISTGIPKLDAVIYGIQKKYLYTIGADTSGGKTSFAIDVFVYNLVKNSGDTPISILYYSFEMSADILYAKILSLYIWDTFNEVVTFEDILSLTNPISDEHEVLVDKSTDWLYSLQDKVTIYDKSLTADGVYGSCKEWLRQFGEFKQIDEHREDYKEIDPERYKVVLIDHVALLSGSDTKKAKIDLLAKYMIYFRNKCNITGIFVQQLNRNAKDMARRTQGYELIQLDDFKDTSDTLDASEVVFALFYPHREKLAKCEGFLIKNTLESKFRLLQIIKNRYGLSDKNIGLNFFGEISLFREMPKPEEITDYSEFIELNYKNTLKLKEKDEDVCEKPQISQENKFIL